MYKFSKRSTQMINFNNVFSDQLTVKRIGIGIVGLLVTIVVLVSCLIVFSRFDEVSALSSNNQIQIFDSSGKTITMQKNESCYWVCSPCDMSCYTAWDDLGPVEFNLDIYTSFGWAKGTARCQDAGLRDPGNYDIRGRTGGIPGDSHGYCTIIYTGYWIEEDGYGYHHWDVNNYDSKTAPDYQRWSGSFKALAHGTISVDKRSTWSVTEQLSYYTFLTCKYDVYYSLEDATNRTNIVTSMYLDAGGHAVSLSSFIANQKLYVRESNLAFDHGCGYYCNDDIGYVVIQPEVINPVIWSDGTTVTYDVPYVSNASVGLVKCDNQTGEKGITQGGIESFENAYYEFHYVGTYFKNNEVSNSQQPFERTWVMATDENGEVSISEKYRNNKVSGDDFIEWNGQIVLPLGSCFIREVKPPDGYLISDKQYRVDSVFSEYEADKIEVQIIDLNTGENIEKLVDPQTLNLSFVYYEQVIRGDYKFLKVNERGETLDGIPFKITSQTTGEWHIAVSDNDGIIDTSSSHFPHTNSTNFNDSLYNEETNSIDDEDSLMSNSGLWFALNKKTGEVAEANDSLGAFPYDTYIIEEIPISKNKKYLPFESRIFVVDNHGYLIEGPQWVNKEPFIPIVPINEILPQTGDIPLWIFGLPIFAVLCYIMRRWVYYRKY